MFFNGFAAFWTGAQVSSKGSKFDLHPFCMFHALLAMMLI